MVRIDDIIEVVEELGKKKKTTSKESWKLFERTVASDFGTTRTPLSGMVKTITNSDTLHPKIYVECKYRNDDYPFWYTFEQMRIMNPTKIVVLSIMPKGRKMVHLYYCEDFFTRIRDDKPIVLDCTNKYKGVNTLFEQTIERAEIEDKVPVIAIKKKGGKGYLIGIAPQDFQKLKSILNKNGTSTENGANQLRRRRGSIGEK